MTFNELNEKLKQYSNGIDTDHSYVEQELDYENEYISVVIFANSNKWINKHTEMETMWSIIYNPKKDFSHLKNWKSLQKELEIEITPVRKGVNIGKFGIRIRKMKKKPDEEIIKQLLDFIFSK